MTAWTVGPQPSQHCVDVCSDPSCRPHAGIPGLMAYAPGSEDWQIRTGSVSTVCCFDSHLGTMPDDRMRFLRECRRVLAGHGIAIFGCAEWIEPLLGAAGFGEWCRESVGSVLAGYASAETVVVARAEHRRPAAAPPYVRGTALEERFASASPAPETTIVVPVRNEENNLRAFFAFLENTSNRLGSRREFVVVVNGSNDRSADVARELADTSPLDVRVVESEPGIFTAFRAGAHAASFRGFVGKLDVDVIAHPHLLDALESHLLSDPKIRVTHAEPLPSDTFCRFSEPDHRPETMSPRLYYNGKASLYRSDPFQWPGVSTFPAAPQAEDVFYSFYLALIHGPTAIGLAPGAFVFQKTIGTLDDLVKMLSRTRSEIGRLTRACTAFAPLVHLFDQQVFSEDYRKLLQQANAEVKDVEEWLRLESTK